jgi:hypothetical protein
MNQRLLTVQQLRTRLVRILLIGVLPIFALAAAPGAEPKPPAEPKPLEPARPARKEVKKTKRELTGAELYAIHCNRCHPERYAPERAETQWQTILTHMRVRANLPAQQAKTILKFLQEDSGK